MSDDLVGRTVGGRFRLESPLAAGGMGAVYVATDTKDGTRVAVKVIRETLAESKEAIARFEREVKATEALQHPNIVRFLDAGKDGGLLYLAMELLEGSTLKERILTRGAIPWRETLTILRGIVNALDAAHAAGLIHRDLKPENVFLAVDSPGAPPQVKLLDFGVAKHTALPDGMTMTGTGIIVGTPGFVAPEVVLHGVTNDPRSDFYALGATWFEMLTGSKPFSAATPFALAMRHLNETPPRPTDLVPFAPIPPPVEELVARLLSKIPDARPANAAALRTALDALEHASLTPMPTPSALGLTSVDKTVTDMQTPRPDAQLLDAHALATKRTPDTGFMPFPDGASPEPQSNAHKNRRVALIGLGALAVVTVVALASSRRRPRRDRKLDRVVATPRAPVAAAQQDAGLVPTTDAGPAATPVVDAGPPPTAKVPPHERPKNPQQPRQPRDTVRPQLDIDDAGQ